MIISVKASSSVDFGDYLTNRKKEAFFIIEGESKRADLAAKELLESHPNKKISHYSYVLSFKEEDISKDEMIEHYLRFKEMMFSQYKNEELEILSVIHFDDNKPHIHCAVLNGSMIDNGRDLRLFRGNVDISRVTSVQEIINYENDLASPFENSNLLSLTPSQQKRDWLVKKGKPYYRVFDDTFELYIEKALKECSDFDSFVSMVEGRFGRVLIKNKKGILKENGLNESLAKGEFELVLVDKKLPNGIDNYKYSSKLFNEKWFKKKISEIKANLDKGKRLKNIKYSQKRKSLNEYRRIFKETTDKHIEHLNFKKVGKEFLDNNFDFVSLNSLNMLSVDFDLSQKRFDDVYLDYLSSKVERYLSFSGKNGLLAFAERFDKKIEVDNNKVFLKLSSDNKIEIFNDDFVGFVVNGKKSSLLEKGSLFDSEDKEIYKELFFLLKKINDNKAKARVRVLLEELIYKKKITSKESMEFLFDSLGLSVKRFGSDVKKGNYITLENEYGKVSIYNDFIASFFNKKKENDFNYMEYKKKRDNRIEDHLKGDNFFHTFVTDVYFKNIDKYNKMYKKAYNQIDNIYDYRLYKSDTLIDVYFRADKLENDKNKNDISYNGCKIDIVEMIDDDTIKINKSINGYITGKNIADSFALKSYTQISLENVTDEMRMGIIDRIKEKKYNLSVIESSEVIFSSDTVEKALQKEQENVEIEYSKDVLDAMEKKLVEIEENGNINKEFEKMYNELKRKEILRFN